MGAYGLFFVNGLAVGAIYALSGIGLVVLYRSTGVLNLAYGAVGAMGAMLAWQLQQWGYAEPVIWLVALAAATSLSSPTGFSSRRAFPTASQWSRRSRRSASR